MNYDTHPETKQKSRPLSRGIYAILQREQSKDVQKGQEIGRKLFTLGTDLKHMKMTRRVLSKLDELLSKISQLEGKKLIWALKPAMLALI